MILLSILIPSIPERLENLKAIIAKYEGYITKYNLDGEVEILSITDNKKRSIGKKRSNLITLAEGRYWVMSDDDNDFLTEAYFQNIMEAIEKDVDVITYMQYARINQLHTFVEFRLGSVNEPEKDYGTTKRPAWHCCTWKREVVKDLLFGDYNYGEDDVFASHANKAAKTEYHIPKVCHVYQHDTNLSAANP